MSWPTLAHPSRLRHQQTFEKQCLLCTRPTRQVARAWAHGYHPLAATGRNQLAAAARNQLNGLVLGTGCFNQMGGCFGRRQTIDVVGYQTRSNAGQVTVTRWQLLKLAQPPSCSHGSAGTSRLLHCLCRGGGRLAVGSRVLRPRGGLRGGLRRGSRRRLLAAAQSLHHAAASRGGSRGAHKAK